ncbi:MAG: ribosomal RNA small subunit methyltransferase A, partial [Planctomycetia bacterium]
MTSEPAASVEPVRQTTAYLKRLFAQVGFQIDSRRGQNFLVDLNLLDLLERSAGRVVSVEIDPRLAQLARERLLSADVDRGGRVALVEEDVLASKHRFSPAVVAAVEEALRLAPGGRFRLVANLPYCVATPVISNLLASDRPFDSATVTVQREMAERMTAAAGSSAYNALSVWVGAQCRGTIVRILPPSVFWPRPKVESAIVHLELEPSRRAAIADLDRFHEFVRDVFCHRRKLLRGVSCGWRAAAGRTPRRASPPSSRRWGCPPTCGPSRSPPTPSCGWSRPSPTAAACLRPTDRRDATRFPNAHDRCGSGKTQGPARVRAETSGCLARTDRLWWPQGIHADLKG